MRAPLWRRVRIESIQANQIRIAASVSTAQHESADRSESRGVNLLAGLFLGEFRASTRQLLEDLRTLQGSGRLSCDTSARHKLGM